LALHPILQNSHGTQPKVIVDDIFPEGIVSIDYADEARTLLVGTGSGSLILLNALGDQVHRELGFEGIRFLRWCDTGQFGIVALNDGPLVCFDRRLRRRWDVRFTGDVVGLAINSYGSHIAVTSQTRAHIVTTDKKEIARFETTRPLEFLHFLNDEPTLIGAAEFGHLCSHDLDGREQWNERIANNVGDMAVTACGKRILLAAFNHGVQLMTRTGKHKGAFMVDGIPAIVDVSANKQRIAVTTIENRIYWMNFSGDLLWACDMSTDPPVAIAVGPLGERRFVATRSGRLLLLTW